MAKYASVRPDLLKEGFMVPVGDTFVGEGKFEYEWSGDDLYIFLNDKWQRANSIDFIFE